jgi:DNA-binding NtrC family response regulator
VLIVEPDRLTRWSMEEYLRARCEVETADSVEVARGLLDAERFDAIVIADDLPHDGANDLEQHARSCNPDLAAVRTVTNVADTGQTGGPAILLEKPFELVSLARVLGFEEE